MAMPRPADDSVDMSQRPRWWVPPLIAVLVTLVHFVITFVGMMVVMLSALGPINWLGHVLVLLVIPLGFPATFIIGRWVPSLPELSNGDTAALFLASSCIWGLASAQLWRLWANRNARPTG